MQRKGSFQSQLRASAGDRESGPGLTGSLSAIRANLFFFDFLCFSLLLQKHIQKKRWGAAAFSPRQACSSPCSRQQPRRSPALSAFPVSLPVCLKNRPPLAFSPSPCSRATPLSPSLSFCVSLRLFPSLPVSLSACPVLASLPFNGAVSFADQAPADAADLQALGLAGTAAAAPAAVAPTAAAEAEAEVEPAAGAAAALGEEEQPGEQAAAVRAAQEATAAAKAPKPTPAPRRRGAAAAAAEQQQQQRRPQTSVPLQQQQEQLAGELRASKAQSQQGPQTTSAPPSENSHVRMARALVRAPLQAVPTRLYAVALEIAKAVELIPPNVLPEDLQRKVQHRLPPAKVFSRHVLLACDLSCLVFAEEIGDARTAFFAMAEASDKMAIQQLIPGVPEDALSRWTLNVAMAYAGPQGPVEWVSLITPLWTPRIQETKAYAVVIYELLKARLAHPAWERFAGKNSPFTEAHKVISQVMGFVCGDDGVLTPQRQHCKMHVEGSVQGEKRGLQLTIENLPIDKEQGRPSKRSWLEYQKEGFYSESMDLGFVARPPGIGIGVAAWQAYLSQPRKRVEVRVVANEPMNSFFLRLKTESPLVFLTCLRLLGWPEGKTQLESEEEAAAFHQAFQSARFLSTPSDITWASSAVGEEQATALGQQVLIDFPSAVPRISREVIVQTTGGAPMPAAAAAKFAPGPAAGAPRAAPRAPEAAAAEGATPPWEKAATRAAGEPGATGEQEGLARRMGGERKETEIGVQTQEEGEGFKPAEGEYKRLPWERYSQELTRRHGPYTRPPTWVTVSEDCPVSPSSNFNERKLDLTKSTGDVLYRLSLLYPSLLSQAGPTSSTFFAALCTSTGVLLNAWQQHLEASGVEAPAAAVAHISFIEKVSNLHVHLVPSEEEADPEYKGAFKRHVQRQKELQAFSAIRAGGSVAIAAFESGGGLKLKARSLYGGIANTLGVPLVLPQVVRSAFADFLHAKLRILPQQKGQLRQKRVARKARQEVMGLCAALHVSAVLRDCSKQGEHELLQSLLSSTIDGRTFAAHLMVAGRHQLAAVPGLLELCDPQTAEQLYGDVMRKLLAAVSPQWEEQKMSELFTRWKLHEKLAAAAAGSREEESSQDESQQQEQAPTAPTAPPASGDEGEETDKSMFSVDDNEPTDAAAGDTEADSSEAGYE
ncbi:hypothetical protein Esti_005592 [Eimeria stiedai]